MAKRIHVDSVPTHVGSGYPAPYGEAVAKRQRKRLAEAAGLDKIGVTLLRLPPGVWSTQRHWHMRSDEFVYVLAGEVVLVTDHGEETLRAGDCAGFRAGDQNGHHLQNRSPVDALILEIGNHLDNDTACYPDIDLVASLIDGRSVLTHRDGTLYEKPA
ncbi:MAG TPA: cupin domain-containing protein [Rhizomicrobium sp.]|nr:cupin domain-containing protein [Rhizomicrobium sp.]